MDATTTTLVWFRQDLRLEDNPALAAACTTGGAVVPVYILDDRDEQPWQAGGASRWWLHHSLKALDGELRKRGSRLVLARGEPEQVLADLVRTQRARAVHWNRRYEPEAIKQDSRIKASLTGMGVDARSFNAALLFEPYAITNKQGGPFQVFTPYWRHCLSLPVARAEGAACQGVLRGPTKWPRSLMLDELELLPRRDWASAFGRVWKPGESGAREKLEEFLRTRSADYDTNRDLPSVEGTSRLSPHLHFGELGPRQAWAAARRLSDTSGVFPINGGVQRFLTEIGWREFAHHLLYHFPDTPEQPLRKAFKDFPWAKDPGDRTLRAWQKGMTGYPIVDAGMRQLWTLGWMHNRVRMVTASFLVKHLRLPWNHGAAWFWDTLVDADLASNTLGWQWSAGCGADAAPYFRIFAPVTQGEKFDPEGHYVKTWVPELAGLPARYIHKPWEASAVILKDSGVVLGRDYPRPIVDHATARTEALAAFRTLRSA